jgi:hypothetical protein
LLSLLILVLNGCASQGQPVRPQVVKPPAKSEIQSLQLKDYLGQEWKHDLVTFVLDRPVAAGEVARLSLLAPGNVVVPFQITPFGAKSKISFLADLPAYGESTYRLVRYKSKPSVTPLQVQSDDNFIRVTSGATGIEVPTSDGNYKDGPLLRLQMKSGNWIGGSRLTTPRTIESYGARVARQGPVFVDVECAYKFSGGKSWKLDFRVIAGEPVVLVNETFDLEDDSLWEFVANRGLPLSHAVSRVAEDTVYSATPLQYDDSVQLKLFSWVPWWSRQHAKFFTFIGAGESTSFVRDEEKQRLVTNPARSAAPGSAEDDALIIAAGHVAPWARSGPEIYDNGNNKFIGVKGGKDGQLALQMQLAAPGRSWIIGTGSAQAALAADNDVAPAQKLMNRYGESPLNEVKDMPLRWQRQAGTFPRLMLKPADVKRIVAAPDYEKKLALNPATQELKSVLLPLIAGRAAGQDQKRINAVKESILKQLDQMVEYWRYGNNRRNSAMFGSIVARQNVFYVLLPLDLAMGADIFTPSEQERIFAQLAFVADKLNSTDYVSTGRSYAGNPNMVTNWSASLALMACMMPDHPHAKQWYDNGMGRLDNMLEKWEGPTGAWLEAPHYMMVALDSIILAKIAAANAGFTAGKLDERILRTITFLAKISTPRDPRFENRRHYPPLGNTYLMETSSVFGVVAKLFREQEPEKAAALQWMWQEQGKPTWAGLGGDFSLNFYKELTTDDDWKVPPPKWASENIPGFGAVLRSGFNTDRETYMVYHQGEISNAHYDYDQGSFEMWGKGRPLSLDWGYAGRAPAWQHNRMDIGTQGKVLAFAHSPGVDYLHGQQDGGWDRQVLFLKDSDPLGPNYFILRDTTKGSGSAPWWLWINTRKNGVDQPATANPIEIKGDVVRASGESDVGLDVWFAPERPDRLKKMEIKDLTVATVKGLPDGSWSGWDEGKTTQHGLHIEQPMGEPLIAVLYPRLNNEASAEFTSLAGGKAVKVVSTSGTDYAFVSLEPFTFQDGPASFSGTAGAIQIRGKSVTLTLGEAGEVSYGKARLKAEKATAQQFEAF